MQGLICGSLKNETKNKGGSIHKKKGWRHASKITRSSIVQSPAQVGVMGWQKGVSHGECRVGYNCGLSVSVLFLLSPCVSGCLCVLPPNQEPFAQ